MQDLLSFTHDTITVQPWDDPSAGTGTIAGTGTGVRFDPRDEYVEFFWLPSLGPSALWMIRRIASFFAHDPSGFEIHLPSFARQLGLGNGTARQSPFRRAFERLVLFDLASPGSPNSLYVRRSIPPIAQRQLLKLPASLRQLHAEWSTEPDNRISVSEMRSRALNTALTMRAAGSNADQVVEQLTQWHFHPAVVHDAVTRAFSDKKIQTA